MRRLVPALLLAAPVLLVALSGEERRRSVAEVGKYLFDPGGRVRAVRTADVDEDGRLDVLALVQDAQHGEDVLLVLRTPHRPVEKRYYPDEHVVRIPCDGELAAAGAVAVGRFGPEGAVRFRFLGPDGIRQVRPDGGLDRFDHDTQSLMPRSGASLFGRSAGRALVFWDGVADLDGDGRDELWFPRSEGNGAIQVLAGRPQEDRLLSLEARNLGSSSDALPLSRRAYVPNLFPADLDGDGRRELVALQGTELVAWAEGMAAGGGAPVSPAFRVKLPFLEEVATLGPEEVRTPRIQLADVDGDGVTDLLVTLITGDRRRIESMRTIFFYYPGPFRDPETGALVKPRARIDTRSIVHHPSFVDLDGDGDLDYVGDSIRGTRLDLIARVMGQDPLITFVGFRYERERGAFEDSPYFTLTRTYPSSEALSNRFGRNGSFEGDFDGDGLKDLLDLSNLEAVGVLRAAPNADPRAGDPVGFDESLLSPVPVKEGLAADVVVADLNGDGRADAVLWSRQSLFLVVSKEEP